MFLPKIILAQQIGNPVLDQTVYNPTDPLNTTAKVISTFVGVMLTLSIIYFFTYVIFAGFNFMTSEGDKNKLETAKNQLSYALLGFAVIVCLFGILRLISTITGVDMINIKIPTIN